MRSLFILLAAAGTVASGCTTVPDPAVVCTAEWIQPRAQKAVGEIEKDTRSVFNTLNKSAKNYEQGKTPGPLELFRLTSAVDRLSKELKSGQGIKDLRMLRDTCDDPDLVADALTGFMQDKGLPAGLIDFIQALDMYQRAIRDEDSPTA